ncbi:group1 glycosyl transferase [Ralstonia sp. A12]|nr:group1 glycosyl transferase [Ralstonia sp. A12]
MGERPTQTPRPLNVWIINPYGTLPDEAWREYRSSMLATALRRAGHQVTWWISNFEHRSKTFRTSRFEQRSLADGVRINLVPTLAYSSHISLDRIRSERAFAKGVVAYATKSKNDRPDIIVLADPSLFFAPPLIKLARTLGAKLVVDILDLWPEVFALALPKPLRPLHRLLFLPLYWRRQRTLRAAQAIVAVSRDYLDVGTTAAPGKPSLVSYLGVDVAAVRQAAGRAREILQRLKIEPKAPGEIWVVYAGTLGAGYDIESILLAMKSDALARYPMRFFFAGDGPQRQLLQQACDDVPERARYLGTLDPSTLNALYAYCDIGLSTYLADSTVSMPVKFYDYLASGLAIVNSLGREIGQRIEENRLGLRYRAGDAASLAQALATLAASSQLLAEYKRNAAAVATTFDQRSQHDIYAHFLTTLTEAPRC